MSTDYLKTLSDAELDQLRRDAEAEIFRRYQVSTAAERAAEVIAGYEDAVKDEPARDYTEGLVIGPGERVIEDGTEWRNTSGAWLSVPPSAYPLGYQRTEAPSEAAPWTVGEVVTAGDLRTYEGTVYQCLQPHTTQADWTPVAAVSLWTVA